LTSKAEQENKVPFLLFQLNPSNTTMKFIKAIAAVLLGSTSLAAGKDKMGSTSLAAGQDEMVFTTLAAGQDENIIEVAQRDGNFTTLLAALDAAGLTDVFTLPDRPAFSKYSVVYDLLVTAEIVYRIIFEAVKPLDGGEKI
jgi:uncharacterized surface protein with fasciclin (FAS1) repeats